MLQLLLSLVHQDFATTSTFSFGIPANILANFFFLKNKNCLFGFGNGRKACVPKLLSYETAVGSRTQDYNTLLECGSLRVLLSFANPAAFQSLGPSAEVIIPDTLLLLGNFLLFLLVPYLFEIPPMNEIYM